MNSYILILKILRSNNKGISCLGISNLLANPACIDDRPLVLYGQSVKNRLLFLSSKSLVTCYYDNGPKWKILQAGLNLLEVLEET